MTDIEATLARIERRLEQLAGPSPVAVKRTQAAKLMGVSLRKLGALISAKKIRTTEDPHLVPMSEVRRYCAPKSPRQRKPSVGHRARIRHDDGQSDEAIAEMRRRLRGAQ